MRTRHRLLLLLILALFLAGPSAPAGAEEKNGCLNCHGEKNITKKGSHLYVDPVKYGATTHAMIGCAACHDRVSRNHPADGIRPNRAACAECHGPVFEEYAKSVHSAGAGCTDCHNPHAVKQLAAVSARDVNNQCERCHDTSTVISSHSRWLPQSVLHIDSLPCIICHTGSKGYVITMYLARREQSLPFGDFTIVTPEDLNRINAPDNRLGILIDTNGDNFISLEELKKFNTSLQYRNLRLLGTMMPDTIRHNYQTMDNRWDCTFCHASGPRAVQTSYLAFPEKNGTYVRIDVEKGAILDMLYGTPDFYMLGATRSSLLSVIGAVIAAFGLLVPIVHGTLRLLTRKNRKEEENAT